MTISSEIKEFIAGLRTVSHVAGRFGVDRKTVYNWISRGTAPEHVTIQGVHYFPESALTSFTPSTRGKPHARH